MSWWVIYLFSFDFYLWLHSSQASSNIFDNLPDLAAAGTDYLVSISISDYIHPRPCRTYLITCLISQRLVQISVTNSTAFLQPMWRMLRMHFSGGLIGELPSVVCRVWHAIIFRFHISEFPCQSLLMILSRSRCFHSSFLPDTQYLCLHTVS